MMFHLLKLLLPALIPSWRFFDVITGAPRIEYAQLMAPGEVVSEWREFRPRPQRVSFLDMLRRLFWNARWNETLFVVSCAERLIADPTTHSQDEIFHRIAGDLTERPGAGGTWLSFRILIMNEREGSVTEDIAFVSDPRRVATIPVR